VKAEDAPLDASASEAPILVAQPSATPQPESARGATPSAVSVDEGDSPPILTDLPTQAPRIGDVLDLPDAALTSGQAWWTPGWTADGLVAGAYRVAAASAVGASHAVSGSVRQDAYAMALISGGRLVVAVADGLGSQHASQVGARLVVEGCIAAGIAAGEARPEPGALLRAGSQHARRVLTQAYGLAPREARCVAAVGVFSEADCMLARIGDVSAFTLDPEEGFREVFPDDGASAPLNEVGTTVPDDDGDDLTPHVAVSNGEVLVLVTDGLASDLRTSPALRAWLCNRWARPLGPHAISDTLRYRRRGSHDDRTAVVVWRQ
jgi:serine/threonine protein phosphatase PrpC